MSAGTVIWSRNPEPVVFEYREGMKFCHDCERWIALDGFHYRTRKGKKQPQPYCIGCMRARWHKWNKKARKSQVGTTPVAYRPFDPLACMGTVGGMLRGSL